LQSPKLLAKCLGVTNALLTPVPKVSKPNSFSDLHPISVIPQLSRLAEKVTVHHWLQPVGSVTG